MNADIVAGGTLAGSLITKPFCTKKSNNMLASIATIIAVNKLDEPNALISIVTLPFSKATVGINMRKEHAETIPAATASDFLSFTC